jgi:glycosyltransferase involved in cell wall biosynthesis
LGAVSILMPCRNAAPHLGEAIASVRAQTFTDFEVIAVDDGSTDSTFDQLYGWARADGRVRVIQGHGRGLVAALATGLAAARGEIIARMDADDIAEPTRLERQMALMRADPRVAACGTRVEYFPDAVVRDGARRYERWLNAVTTPAEIERDMFIECPIPHPTLVARRSVLAGVGGYREMGWPEDYDLILRIWAAGHRLAKVPEVLLRWREHAGRASRQEPRYHPDRFSDVKIHFLQKTLLAGGREAVVWGAGPIGKSFARKLTSAGTRVIAFVEVAPGKIGQEIHGAPVVAPHRAGEFAGAGSPSRALVLAAVGQAGARETIREACRDLGLVEGEDYIAVA